MVISTYWRLTIHHWPRATDVGVRPQPTAGFDSNPSPALYQPHEIDFTHPPTREDFLAVVRQTPWMQAWDEDLLPVVERNQWPMVAPGYKAASVDLTDRRGRVVGRLDVRRKEHYGNAAYSLSFVGTYPGSDVDRFLARRVRDKGKRDEARQHVEALRNMILERLAHGGDHSPVRVLDEVERVLADAGFVRRARITATA